MLFLYNAGIRIYSVLLWLISPFNPKAKLWTKGRKDLLNIIAREVDRDKKYTWFHFPSLGEFEQGRPVLENIKLLYPEKSIIITFYSPSGYELRKNYSAADHVFYLPADTPKNAKRFISLVNPESAIFTKYDYWYHYFNELNARGIPLFVISAIFRRNYSLFQWYGSLQRQMLAYITTIFVQDEESKVLLNGIGVTDIIIAGDTRFDRVVENALKPKNIPEVQAFADSSNVLVAGSTWPQDEKHIRGLAEQYPDWKFIIAPHEISESRISSLTELFPLALKYSKIKGQASDLRLQTSDPGPRVLIIDNIGMLSSLYQYGNIAYIGGGFGVGIHNTLEAAVFGLPVIFGPNYDKFREARGLLSEGAAFTIEDYDELKNKMEELQDTGFRTRAGQKALKYVTEHTGATKTIIDHIYQQ